MVRAGAGAHPRRRQLARARVRLGRRRPVLRRARRTARASSTPTAASTSTTCSRGARRSSGTRIPAIVEAVQRAAADGTSFGAPTAREVELAEAICDRVPSVEKVRLVSSGTEAAMTAVRLARGATGRVEDREVRGLLPRPPRRAARRRRGAASRRSGCPARPASRREPSPTRSSSPTTTSPRSTRRSPSTAPIVAAVLVEPIAANMGLVPPGRRLPRRVCASGAPAAARCSCSTR